MDRWKGRVAVVTGASSGIGYAVAADLARAGMRVVAVARRRERLDALVRELPDAEVLALPADLRAEEQILGLFEQVRRDLGGVDVLVNNAGLGHSATLWEGPTDKWREMLDVNVLALCVCTREALQDMRRRDVDGHVVHIGSMAGHRVPPGSGFYSATKFAVRALTEALRQELRAAGSQIRVTAISPGFVETEFAGLFHGSEDTAKEVYSRYPTLQSDDIASAVRYALSAPAHMQVHDILIRPTDQPT